MRKSWVYEMLPPVPVGVYIHFLLLRAPSTEVASFAENPFYKICSNNKWQPLVCFYINSFNLKIIAEIDTIITIIFWKGDLGP